MKEEALHQTYIQSEVYHLLLIPKMWEQRDVDLGIINSRIKNLSIFEYCFAFLQH